jgi:CheY-like chemotaxis protein
MVLDDDKMIIQFIKQVLSSRSDCVVKTFSSPAKAIDHLSDQDYDVIISDFRMPEMDGVTFLKKIVRYGLKPYASC